MRRTVDNSLRASAPRAATSKASAASSTPLLRIDFGRKRSGFESSSFFQRQGKGPVPYEIFDAEHDTDNRPAHDQEPQRRFRSKAKPARFLDTVIAGEPGDDYCLDADRKYADIRVIGFVEGQRNFQQEKHCVNQE